MTQPIRQEEIRWGNQQPPPYPQLQNNQLPTIATSLKGSKVRQISGIVAILCGVVEIGLAIALVCLPVYYYSYDYRYENDYYADDVGWGIWNGVFAIFAGFFGVYSQRSKCTIITYMVLSILAAVMSASCLIWAAISSSQAASSPWDAKNAYNHIAMYITLCIIFAIQMVASIVGASMTCAPLCFNTGTINQGQRMVYFAPYQFPQQQVQTILPPTMYQQSPPMQAAGYSDVQPPSYPIGGAEAK